MYKKKNLFQIMHWYSFKKKMILFFIDKTIYVFHYLLLSINDGTVNV